MHLFGAIKSWGNTFLKHGMIGVHYRLTNGESPAVSQPAENFSFTRFRALTATRPFLPTLIFAASSYGTGHYIAGKLATVFPNILAVPLGKSSHFDVTEMFLISAGIATAVEIYDLMKKYELASHQDHH